MTPEQRIAEGERLIEAVNKSEPCSWARFQAFKEYYHWVRGHSPSILRATRKGLRGLLETP